MPDVAKVKAGGANPEWLAGLPAAELQAWITRLLRGQEADIPTALTDTPEDVLLDAYEAANACLKGALADAVLALVEEMAWDAASVWRTEVSPVSLGDRLVLAALSVGDRRTVSAIRHMVESRDFVGKPGAMGGGVHARLLQGLIALGVEETEAFWRREVQVAPAVLVLAMRGLAEAGNPFALLREAGDTVLRELEPDLVRLLDVLRAAKGSGWLREAVRPYRHLLPPGVAAEVADLFPRQTTSPAGLSDAGGSPWA